MKMKFFLLKNNIKNLDRSKIEGNWKEKLRNHKFSITNKKVIRKKQNPWKENWRIKRVNLS